MEPIKRTIVVTYVPIDGDGIVRLADRSLERILGNLPYVAEVELHYEDMLERGGH